MTTRGLERERDTAGPAAMGVSTRPAAGFPELIAALPRHVVRMIGGIDLGGLRARLDAAPPSPRPVIALDLAGSSVEELRRSALEQVARAVAEVWPCAWGGEDFGAAREDPLTLAHLPLRVAALAECVGGLSQPWARAAIEARLRGRAPRADAPAELEWGQLCLMLSPGGLVVVSELGQGREPAAFVRVVEWLAAHADVAVAVLAARLPPPVSPWTRLLHGACSLDAPAPAAMLHRAEANLLVALPEVRGRPHPLSAVEMRLFRHLRDDAELQPLFGFNLVADGVDLLPARVDVLWQAGRVVVEIDGAEHRGAGRYRADRDRDHRLMCAGYRVLRLTNEDVLEDGARAVEKIRDVVRLARKDQPWTPS